MQVAKAKLFRYPDEKQSMAHFRKQNCKDPGATLASFLIIRLQRIYFELFTFSFYPLNLDSFPLLQNFTMLSSLSII
jgi:hypothetical protein